MPGVRRLGSGRLVTVGDDDFTPLIRGAIVFGGDGRKGIALLDDVDSAVSVVRVSFARRLSSDSFIAHVGGSSLVIVSISTGCGEGRVVTA